MKFLSKGLFEKDFMQSKVTSHSMSFQEKLWGYALGPGFVAVYTCMVTSLREMFYMSVMPMDSWYGSGTYMTLQTATSIIGIFTGLLFNYIMEHTVSRAGRFRPYVLIGTILMALSGIGMFWSPFGAATGATLAWLWVVNILYFCVATVMFNHRGSVLSVSTRSLTDRNFVTTLRSCMESMIPGIFGAIIVTGWLYFVFLANDTTGNYWRLFIAIPAVVAIFAAIIQYFFTRERITEENRDMNNGADEKISVTSLLAQVKALLSNKYYLLGIAAGLMFTLGSNLQGANARTYYTQWILGANDQNGLATIYLMISMQPMAFGAVIIPMLARKHGSRKILMISSLVTLAGIALCYIDPANFGIACGGGLVFSSGCVALSNMNSVIGQQAADMVEYKHGFRVEGTLAAGLIGILTGMIMSPTTAIYETVLHNLGFDAYATAQNAAVNSWITFAYYGGYAIQAIGVFLVLIFFNAEKHMPVVHAELKERRKAAVLARGEEWFDDEEYERLQREEAARVAEENRIADLKEKCAKKGLDFDKENQKYLDKIAKKQAKAAKKAAKKNRQKV